MKNGINQYSETSFEVLEHYELSEYAIKGCQIKEESAQTLSKWILDDNMESLKRLGDEILAREEVPYLTMMWKEMEEVQLVVFSGDRRIRAIEFADYVSSEYGLVKGNASVATGRISTAILKVLLADADMEVKDADQYFYEKVRTYFTGCDWIYASQYSEDYRGKILDFPRYVKKRVTWAFVESTQIVESGEKFQIKSLENESGITITASPEIYIMIGSRGEVYDINRSRFEGTYDATEEAFDVFEMMVDFIPFAEKAETGECISLDDKAHLCYPKQGGGIYAMPLEKRTKIFPSEQGKDYFLGHKGDYMAVRMDDLSDIYVIQKDIFAETYELYQKK